MSNRKKTTSVMLASLFAISAVLLPRAAAVDAVGKTEFQVGYPQAVNSPGGTMPGSIKIYGQHTLPTGNPSWSHWASVAKVKNRAAGNTANSTGLSELNLALGTSGANCTEISVMANPASYDVWIETTWIRWVNGVQESQSQQSATETKTVS